MINFAKLFKRNGSSKFRPKVPEGQRFYVIGDIHGRCDLLDELILAIEEDDAQVGQAETTIIFLGDLVDRGPESARGSSKPRASGEAAQVRYLAGNHEEMFLQSFEDKEMLRHFLAWRPRNRAQLRDQEKALQRTVAQGTAAGTARTGAQKHRKFLGAMEDIILAGDYAFAHAGINPKRAIDDQQQSDLRWIRDRFLKHREPLTHVVVHGHTIFEDVEHTPYRIGIDTGAFRTGILTALVLEGDQRRIIRASETDGTITTQHAEFR